MSRIIAGAAKGKRLAAPRGDRTRPTTDRTREALFSALVSWLGATGQGPAEQLAGISFLDLFAGSGAVGAGLASTDSCDPYRSSMVVEKALRTSPRLTLRDGVR